MMLGRSQRLEDIYIVENPSKFDPSYIRVNEAAISETKRIHCQFEEYKAKEEAKWKKKSSVLLSASHYTGLESVRALDTSRLIPEAHH